MVSHRRKGTESDTDEEEDEDDEDEEEDDEDEDDFDEVTKVVATPSTGMKRESNDADSSIPLWKRLRTLDNQEVEESSTMTKVATKYNKRKQVRDIQDEKSRLIADNKKSSVKEGRSNKNAPAVMKSNKPVRRLRIDADNTTRKSRDPRFAEGSGNLSHDKFLQAYSFLDKYQEDEINDITKSIKKVKDPDDQGVLKAELFKRKQEMTERRRSLKIKERLSVSRAEEREKFKNGKMPYHLGRNAKKVIALEQRFDELKGEGKLNSFLLKKRKKNANKDHRWLPSRREE